MKKVRFDDSKTIVHVMYDWPVASRDARIGKWEEMARDRERFQMRICRLASIIEPVLERKLKDIEKMQVAEKK